LEGRILARAEQEDTLSAFLASLSFYATYLHCENFSELFRSFGRTYRTSFPQAAFTPLHRFVTHINPEAGRQGAMPKHTRITIETESLLILRGRNSRRAWCPKCAAEAEVIALEEVGVISNLDQSPTEQWVNSPELHRSETPTGSTLICLNSLLARVQKTKTI
jgi:hypothetical protein